MSNYKLLNKGNIGKSKYIIINELKKYLVENPKIESLILGVSGGADSALVAALANDVCREIKITHKRDIKLIGRSLPMKSNKEGETDRAYKVGTLLCDDFSVFNMQTSFLNLIHFMNKQLNYYESRDWDVDFKIRLGNIKARLRMIYLYDLASKHNGMVLSTDNFTEYLLGFWTLHGDVGDYGMIQNLWKTEVFLMLDNYYRYSDNQDAAEALRLCREAVPTDGLGITTSDLDQFGGISSYEEIDEIFIEMITNGYDKFIQQGGVPKVLSMYENTKFKRNNPFNIPRETLIGGREDDYYQPSFVEGGWLKI